MENSLYDMLAKGEPIPDVDGLVTMISARCRMKTVEALRRRITSQSSLLRKEGIYNRLTFVDGVWGYCCGQSRPDEMRTIRECLINGIV